MALNPTHDQQRLAEIAAEAQAYLAGRAAVTFGDILDASEEYGPHHAPARPVRMTTAELAAEQTEAAVEKLYADPAAGVCFPYASVHELVGRVMPGRVVIVAANTGQGKTTFCLDVVEHWTSAGVKLDYLGTEQEPDELRTKLACRRAGVPAGIAINNEWDFYPDGYGAYPTPEAMRLAVQSQLEWLASGPYADRLLFNPEKLITLDMVAKAARAAEQRGAHVLVIDHINRVETGGKGGFAEFTRVVQKVTELGRDHRLVIVSVSQMNREATKGDALGAYRCPPLSGLRGGGTQAEEAHAVLGLWRPIDPDADPDILKRVAARTVEPTAVLEPNTMAVALLKHRTWGDREGRRAKLHVERGHLTDKAARHDHRTGFDLNRSGR